MPKDNIKQYLFVKKEEEYQEKEKNLVDKENLKRKEKMKMDFNEINEFEKNVINNREKYGTENAERRRKMILEWKERKSTLPTYISRKQEMVQEELKKEKENEEHKKEQNLALKQKKLLFGYNIKNNKQPEINDKLKNQRTNLIKSLKNPKLALREKLYEQRQKRAEELLLDNKKENNTINNRNKSIKKIKVKLNESNNNLNNSIYINEKKNSFSPLRIIYPVHPKPKTKIDYLSELRNEKEKKKLKRKALSSEKNDNNSNEQVVNNAKWEKAINNEKGTFIENINLIKEKAKVMDDEVKKKEKILKLNGGVQNNPEIGEKISNLIIDSIEAKLSILNKFNEE